MKKSLFTLICTLLTVTFVYSQKPVLPNTTPTEVGIVEHLGDTIPLDLRFINEKNDTVSLRSLVNKPTIFNFVYFDCPGLCSPLLQGISEVVEHSDMELGKEYQIITISFNYQDSPEKAIEKKKNFLSKHSKNHAKDWMYLTGDSVSIARIADAVGFKFKKVGVDYIHAACIMVVSPKGKITRYLYGLSFLPFDLKMAIIESEKGQVRPTINKFLDFCFSYEPSGKRYAIDVMKVSGSIMLFLLIIFLSVLLFRKRRK
jgi:protein SCO1